MVICFQNMTTCENIRAKMATGRTGRSQSQPATFEEKKNDINIICRKSARFSWIGAGPPALARGARQGRCGRRRHGGHRRSKKSTRASGSLCLCRYLSVSHSISRHRCSVHVKRFVPLFIPRPHVQMDVVFWICRLCHSVR